MQSSQEGTVSQAHRRKKKHRHKRTQGKRSRNALSNEAGGQGNTEINAASPVLFNEANGQGTTEVIVDSTQDQLSIIRLVKEIEKREDLKTMEELGDALLRSLPVPVPLAVNDPGFPPVLVDNAEFIEVCWLMVLAILKPFIRLRLDKCTLLVAYLCATQYNQAFAAKLDEMTTDLDMVFQCVNNANEAQMPKKKEHGRSKLIKSSFIPTSVKTMFSSAVSGVSEKIHGPSNMTLESDNPRYRQTKLQGYQLLPSCYKSLLKPYLTEGLLENLHGTLLNGGRGLDIFLETSFAVCRQVSSLLKAIAESLRDRIVSDDRRFDFVGLEYEVGRKHLALNRLSFFMGLLGCRTRNDKYEMVKNVVAVTLVEGLLCVLKPESNLYKVADRHKKNKTPEECVKHIFSNTN